MSTKNKKKRQEKATQPGWFRIYLELYLKIIGLCAVIALFGVGFSERNILALTAGLLGAFIFLRALSKHDPSSY